MNQVIGRLCSGGRRVVGNKGIFYFGLKIFIYGFGNDYG